MSAVDAQSSVGVPAPEQSRAASETPLDRLLVTLQRARERFLTAADRAENPAFQRAFRLFALQRERLMLQLKPLLTARDSISEHVTSRLTHDAALCTQAPASGGDKALVIECTEAEDEPIEVFEGVLGQQSVSPRLRDMVTMQLKELMTSREQILEWKLRLETGR